MGRLIDTSVFIESERGRLDLESHISAHENDGLFLSVITVSELLHGVNLASPEYRSSRAAAVEGWVTRFSILKINVAIARRHSQVYSNLRAAGSLIGPHDMWLAATCLTYGLTMVTGNLREFRRVEGLKVEAWS